MYEDKFEQRVCNLDKGVLVIHVENTLPIFITVENRLKEMTIREQTISLTGPNLTDDTLENRFTYISSVQSPITKNVAMLYYDKRYKDILILPNLEYLTHGVSSGTYCIRASRLGSGSRSNSRSWFHDVTNAYTSRCALPETKSNIQIKTLLTNFTGTAFATPGNKDEGYVEILSDNKGQIKHNMKRLQSIVNLGTAASLFKEVGPVPVYLLYQHTMMEFGIEYIANKLTDSNNLYVRLKF